MNRGTCSFLQQKTLKHLVPFAIGTSNNLTVILPWYKMWTLWTLIVTHKILPIWNSTAIIKINTVSCISNLEQTRQQAAKMYACFLLLCSSYLPKEPKSGIQRVHWPHPVPSFPLQYPAHSYLQVFYFLNSWHCLISITPAPNFCIKLKSVAQ